MSDGQVHRVVIVGGGFAGLRAAKSLRSPAVQVTLLDRRNHHVFQPLLYQVATGLFRLGQVRARGGAGLVGRRDHPGRRLLHPPVPLGAR
jgi:NADH dehydrogenase FAD-containing subunit